MKLKTKISAAVLSISLSCGVYAMDVEHAKGITSVKSNPAKVIVLDVGALDNLDALGVKITGVPAGNLVHYLDKYQQDSYIKAGTLFEPDIETIKNSKADLVIVGGRSSSKYNDVSPIAPTIDLSINADDYINNTQKTITQLGKIFNKNKEAAQLNTNLSSQIAKLQASTKDIGQSAVLMVNAGKISAIAPTSRMGWLYRDAGFKAIAGIEQFNRENPMPLQFLADANPEWLLVIERDSAIGKGSAETAANKVLANSKEITQTTAWKKGQVVYLYPQESYIVGNGYTALTRIMQQVQTELDNHQN